MTGVGLDHIAAAALFIAVHPVETALAQAGGYPAKTIRLIVPREVVSRLNAAIAAGLKSSDVIQRLDALGYEPIGGTAEQFAATIKSDIAKYAGIIKRAGIKADL